ncbi:MAG: hypothetical protein DRG25_00925, partial [Deltaproteobacteria bacterium]
MKRNWNTTIFTNLLPFLFLALFLEILFPHKAAFSKSKTYQFGRQDKIFAFHFIDEIKGWAVGNRGLVVYTQDGAETWNRIEKVPDVALYDITFIGQNGWIVGREGIILHTKDGGKHWEKQKSPTQASLTSIFFLDQKKGVIAGEGGTVLLTENGGAEWQLASLNWEELLPKVLKERGVISPNLYDLFFLNESYGWMVGDNGMVLFSADGGKHWEVLRIGLFPPLFSVFFKDEKEGWVAGQNGLLLHSKDGGRSWERMNSTTDKSLYRIRMEDGCLLMAGDL